MVTKSLFNDFPLMKILYLGFKMKFCQGRVLSDSIIRDSELILNLFNF